MTQITVKKVWKDRRVVELRTVDSFGKACRYSVRADGGVFGRFSYIEDGRVRAAEFAVEDRDGETWLGSPIMGHISGELTPESVELVAALRTAADAARTA